MPPGMKIITSRGDEEKKAEKGSRSVAKRKKSLSIDIDIVNDDEAQTRNCEDIDMGLILKLFPFFSQSCIEKYVALRC
jgi:hypothetical protein